MKLTSKLALSQIKTNRNRSVMTLLGIGLSSAMLTAVCGFVASAKATIDRALGYDYGNTDYNFTLVAIGAVLGAIIITASVIVVSNAFRVSAGERTRQFGILKSVGATKRQIAATVLYEGILLSVIGIPIGIAVGLLIELIGTSIITNLLNSLSSGGTLHVDSEEFLNFSFAAPPIMFVVAIVTSLGTVLLSAWLPARKAARIPAIDAIRSTGEVKLKRKNVRTSKLTQALFGFEGALAAKSLKRSRRNFRATIVSLTISIVLLVVAGSFGSLMKSTTNLIFPNIDATAVADWSSSLKVVNGVEGHGEVTDVDYISIDTATAETITEKLRNYKNAEIFGVGGIRRYSTALPDGTKTNGALISVDEKHYEELCKTAGVPLGSSLLINLRRETIDGKKTEYVPYDFSKLKGKPLMFSLAGHKPIEVTLTGELTGQDVSNEIAYMYESELAVIVSECESVVHSWFAKVDDVTGFTVYAKQVLDDRAPKSKEGIEVLADCIDIADATKQMRDMFNTIMFFVYGFVGMLTLIAVTSVISTISTNVRSRAREFAVLESVGMTKTGVKKMLNLESILCSVRSLVFGLPLGLFGAYALYRAMGLSVELTFRFPWLSVAECILGVFAVTWVTMRYSASRLKGGSIVETIRGE
jgi:putative ABC transport system permease protein